MTHGTSWQHQERRCRWCFWCVAALIILAGCAPNTPQRTIQSGETIFYDTFEQAGRWQSVSLDSTTLRVAGGALRGVSSLPDRYIWSLNTAHNPADVIITAEMSRFSDYARGIYGLVCRADPSGSSAGYYFLITANGQASIRRGIDRNSEFAPLADWRETTAIRGGEANTVQAICAGEYLALYVNGEFVADAIDDMRTSGYTGVVVGLAGAGEIDVAFDDFRLSVPE